MSVTLLSRADIAAVALTADEVLAAVRVALHRLADGSAVNPEKVKLAGAETVSYAMLGRTGATVGFKTSFTHDPDPGRGRKRYFTTLSLYDERTGAPVALLDGARIGAVRTAAVTALLAAAAANRTASTLLLIGTGTQARESIAPMLAAVPTLQRILIAGSHPEGLAALRSRIAELGHDSEVVDAADAAPDADIVVAAAGPGTTHRAAGQSLRPGCATVLVGYGVDAQSLWSADRVIATSAAQMAVTGGDLLDGRESLRPVDIELPSIIAGTARVRKSQRDSVFAYNSGLIVTDIAVGELIARRAREQGLGQEVSLW